MGDKITLKVENRDIFGKKVKALRKQGLTPGVVYGAGIEPLAIQADSREVARVYAAAGKHTPVQLSGTKRRIAMIKDAELHATKSGIVRHIAFHAVRADEPVVAEVPIRLTGIGDSPAERAGLIVLQAIEKVEVKALPMELPEALEVSIENLTNEGDRLTIGDIELPKGVELIDKDDGREGTDDDNETVKDLVNENVYEPGALAAANEAAAGEATDESEVEGAEEESAADEAEAGEKAE